MPARPIFTDAAIAAFEEADQPVHAVDSATGIRLIYRFDPLRGGVLTCHGGPLGLRTFSRAVPLPRLEETARRMCDGLSLRRLQAPRPGRR